MSGTVTDWFFFVVDKAQGLAINFLRTKNCNEVFDKKITCLMFANK